MKLIPAIDLKNKKCVRLAQGKEDTSKIYNTDPIEQAKFFEDEGNPYNFVGIDNNGDIGLKFGVLGLPVTLLTNNEGEIIYKYLGPLTKKVVQNEISPLLQ